MDLPVTRASMHETPPRLRVIAVGNCPHGDTRHASLVIIRRCPCESLAWNFSFVLIGQSRAFSLSICLVQVYLWGFSF